MEKLKALKKHNLDSLKAFVTGNSKAISVVSAISSIAIAGNAMAVGTSMIDTATTTMIQGFADNIMPTVLTLVAILVPVGMSVWAVGFACNKGVAYLQKRAKTALH